MQDQLNIVSLVEPLLSTERLNGYKTAWAKNLCDNPLKIYAWNMLLSESLYPLLHIIEVVFRNKLYEVISNYFHDPNWLTSSNILFAVEQNFVSKELNRLNFKLKSKQTIGHLIAELSFGFWTGLLDRRYETKQLLWPKLLRDTFPYLNDRKIHLIRRRFNKIRKLRNRVWHYEAIWHWSNLLELHENIIDTIKWIEPKLICLIDVDRVPSIYSQGPNNMLLQDVK